MSGLLDQKLYEESSHTIHTLQSSQFNRSSDVSLSDLLPVNSTYVDNILHPSLAPPIWAQVLQYLEYATITIGFFTNVATVITLNKNGGAFSEAILILFSHQSGIDATLCLLTALYNWMPSMWLTGIYHLDVMVCHIWHGFTINAAVIVLSIWNLVLIAYERFLAICHPFKYRNLTKAKLRVIIALVYMCSILFVLPALFQVTFRDNACYPESHFKNAFGQGLLVGNRLWLFVSYLVAPVILFIVFYGSVLYKFYRRRKSEDMASSQVINKATTELTKTSILVTVIFFFCIGYSHLLYMLSGFKVIDFYVIPSAPFKLGVWLMTVNSMANPFVYASLMHLQLQGLLTAHQK